MTRLQQATARVFLDKAKVTRVRLVRGFVVLSGRNEWVNWDGDTSVVMRAFPEFHPTLEGAEAEAERSRTPGSFFAIRESVGLALVCTTGLIVLHESGDKRCLSGLEEALLPPGTEAHNVAQVLARNVAMNKVPHRWPALVCFSRQDMPDFAPYQPTDTLYWRTSRSGGKRNSLAWTLKAAKADTRGVLALASRLKSLFKTAAERPAQNRSETAAEEQAENKAPSLQSPLDGDAPPKTIEENAPETMREQLSLARVGQGVFRKRLEAIEPCCRLTGVTDPSHLRASHIKPWSESTNIERLDGNNGLLLSPHVDHLFDRGYLSFSDEGAVLISPTLDPSVLVAWRLDNQRNVGRFNSRQKHYLAHHRSRWGFTS